MNVLLVFLGSPCQTKGFRFFFGPVLGLFWSLWRSQGLHFGRLGAPFGTPLGVPWPPFWELWGSPERRGRLVIDPSGDRVANRDFFMTFSTHFGALFGPVLGAKIVLKID